MPAVKSKWKKDMSTFNTDTGSPARDAFTNGLSDLELLAKVEAVLEEAPDRVVRWKVPILRFDLQAGVRAQARRPPSLERDGSGEREEVNRRET